MSKNKSNFNFLLCPAAHTIVVAPILNTIIHLSYIMSYDGERDINPRRYLDRVDSSGACEVRCLFIHLKFINTISKLRSSFCTTTDFNFSS